MYWASTSTKYQAVEMAFLDGTGRATLFSESKAKYSGITLHKDCLYISDQTKRSVFLYCLSNNRNLNTMMLVVV